MSRQSVFSQLPFFHSNTTHQMLLNQMRYTVSGNFAVPNSFWVDQGDRPLLA
jgi:hypothetical protein